MDALPHYYTVAASGNNSTSHVVVSSAGVSDIVTDAPAEFGGPGDQWSPEALMMGAVADCFILTFRAIARASKLEWQALTVEATGTLDRVDRKTQFTDIGLSIAVTVTGDVSEQQVERLLHKAEEGCLITNSLNAAISLEFAVAYA